MSKYEEVELTRDLGLFSATMIGVGAMIGAGIFVLTGIAAGTAGPALLLVFLLNGVVTLFTAMAYAELGSAMPEAGGGYLWVKEAFPGAQGFLSGWMSWLAHTVAGSLYALGFGAYFYLFLSVSGVAIGGLGGEVLKKALAVGVILLFVYINYRGSSETGKAANISAIVKIAILGVFVASGLMAMRREIDWTEHFVPFLPMGFEGVFLAMGLTFIAFEGYEVIAQAGEEMIDPKRNVPRAIFLSLAIVMPIYLLVAFVALGAVDAGGMPTWQFLGQHKELGLAEAAKQFMPLGVGLLLFGGLVSTMSALNATTFSSTRVSFAMGRDFNLPSLFRRIHPINRTPHVALAITAVLMIAIAIGLPIEDVASAADIMFLLLFLQVNAAVINIRKRLGDKLDYGYKMPLFPYLPIAGVLTKLFLALYMYFYSPIAWVITLVWIGIGGLVYRSYARGKEEIEKGKLAREISPGEYRILVPMKAQKDVRPLMEISTAIAKAQGSDVVALHVVEIPYQTFLQAGKRFVEEKMPLLNEAVEIGTSSGITVRKKIVISHDVSRAIVDLAKSGKSDLILLGWTGEIFREKIRRSVPGNVMRNAPCNVAVLHPKNGREIKSILVPVGLGEHSYRLRLAERIAKAFGAKVTLISVTGPGEEPQKERLREIHKKDRALLDCETASEMVTAYSVKEVLVNRSANHDLLVIGPSREWILQDFLFGSVPDRIVNEAKCSVLMVKEPEQRIESWVNLALDWIMRR